MENIKSLKVFSKKLNGAMDVLLTRERLVPAMAMASWLDSGWNNTTSWMDRGWNNTSSWMDGGWNNTSNWSDGGWSNGSSWSDGGWSNGGGGGGCYITTATVDHMGMADDCDELNLLRKYRDELAESDPEFKKVVLEYYKTAPMIVEAISTSENKDEVLQQIYAEMVIPVISLLKAGKVEEAKEHYIGVYNKLKAQYVPEPQKQLLKK